MATRIKYRKIRRNQNVDTEIINDLYDNDKALDGTVEGMLNDISANATTLADHENRLAEVEEDLPTALANAAEAKTTADDAADDAAQALANANNALANAATAQAGANAAQAAADAAASDATTAKTNAATALATATAADTKATQAQSDAAAAAAAAAAAVAVANQAGADVSVLQTTVGTLTSNVNNHETRIVNLEAGVGGGGDPGPTLTDTPPPDVKVQTASPGVSVEAARGDHVHDIAVAAPVSVGSTNQEGSSTSLSRADHVHAHGSQGGGSLHADATTSVSGFMSATDKSKLDGIASGAEVNSASNANTAGVGVWKDKSGSTLRFKGIKAGSSKIVVADSAGDSTVSVDLGTVTASDVGAAPASHVGQGSASAHPNATTSVSGFMSATDKSKLDGIAPGATANEASQFAPPSLNIGTSARGNQTRYAREDHQHSITAGVAPQDIGDTNAEGSSSSVARADHVHRLKVGAGLQFNSGILELAGGGSGATIHVAHYVFNGNEYDLQWATDGGAFFPLQSVSNGPGDQQWVWNGSLPTVRYGLLSLPMKPGRSRGVPTFPNVLEFDDSFGRILHTGDDWAPDDPEEILLVLLLP